MLLSYAGLKPYTDTAYHNEELKSLTRYRFAKVKERAQLKRSVSRSACILFPELKRLVPIFHMASVYALLSEFPIPTKSLKLQHTIRLIRELDAEIWEIEAANQAIMEELHSPTTTIPGIGYRMGTMIWPRSGSFPVLIPLTSCWPMRGCLPPLTSLGNSKTAILTWKNGTVKSYAQKGLQALIEYDQPT
mgnify:CR=1 FL=1